MAPKSPSKEDRWSEIDPAPTGADLAQQGWKRRSVACEPRLSEAVELYRELGLEVLLLPLHEAGGAAGSCTECFDADSDPDRFKIIYTRPTAGLEQAEKDSY